MMIALFARRTHLPWLIAASLLALGVGLMMALS